MNIKYLFPLLFVFLILSACDNNASEIDYESLSESGNWKIVKQDSTEYSGHVKLQKEKWLMHFLHWWAINESNSEISPEYAEDLLLNLWGMQFDLNGIEGETEVNGHKAFYIEGNLRNVVRTVFVVWNCPESNRQFLSDCNINIPLNTPHDLLNLQVIDLTNSVCCHKTDSINENPKLPQQVNYEEQNISLTIPENWRSNAFLLSTDPNKKTPGHYAEGITEKEGAILNLITDSQKEINLIWKKGGTSEINFASALSSVFNDTTLTMQDTLKFFSYYANINSQNINIKNGYIEGEGDYDIITELENFSYSDTSHYQYKAFLWQHEETEYLLFASMAAYQMIMGLPFDLSPTDLQFNNFIRDEVLKNITDHPIIFK